MEDNELECYLPAEVWKALAILTRHVETLPALESRQVLRGIQTLTEKLVQTSRHYNLKYPKGD